VKTEQCYALWLTCPGYMCWGEYSERS